jgi:hypothetical protein
MWSIGCALYKLYTGKILFLGNDNNDMLKYIKQYKGSFPTKKLKKVPMRACVCIGERACVIVCFDFLARVLVCVFICESDEGGRGGGGG